MNEKQEGSAPAAKAIKEARKNQRIFGFVTIVLQICISSAYIFFGHAPMEVLNIASILMAVLMAFLAVAGFGMFFAYLSHLLWSALSLAFLITALTIEVYPLVNAFWAKTGLSSTGLYQDGFDNAQIRVFLGNMDSSNYQNNTITGAIKCSIAVIVALSSVIGRVGPLQCLFMTIVGAFGYEKNRTIIIGVGQDVFGSFSIFTFGGYLGLTVGAAMTFREKRMRVEGEEVTKREGSAETGAHSIIGVLFIFLLLPLLASEGDQSLQAPLSQRTMSPMAVLLSMSSAIVTSMIVGMLVHGDQTYKIDIKAIGNAVIAGGIMCGAASFYTTNPSLALIIGFVAALTQFIYDNYLEKWLHSKVGTISTYSFTLFSLQTLQGAIFAAGYNSRVTSLTSDGFVFPEGMKDATGEIGIYFISAGLGIGSGLLVGLVCYFLNKYKAKDLFQDKTEFLLRDGISIRLAKKKPQPIIPIITEHSQIPQSQINSEYDPNLPDKIVIKQGQGVGSPHSSQVQIVYITPPSSISEGSFDFADMLQVVIQ